ncbi:MAG: hypothetical protein PWQ88_1130 [Candidatus Methanomethylophilaceae archaeon]|nr:hypothetical protein [Candidatus Methanomethylophilaceae archaeon]MDI3542335.1 hypothetical protein [Candidatus Methanomethylophilaceae archaeon]
MMENTRKKDDDNLVDLLIKTGMKKNVAKTLVFLKNVGETTSVEIEKSTSLRQPEVSIAMQELRNRGWVEKRNIKKKGKGRPVHAYRLSVPFSSIIDSIEEDEIKHVQSILNNIKLLRESALD